MPRKSSSRHFTPLTSQRGLTFQRLHHYGPPSDEPSQFALGLTQFDSPARVVTTGRGAARKRRGYSKSVSEKKERRREGRHKSREKSRPTRKEGEFVLELEEEGQENASPRPNAKKGGDWWESDDEVVSSPEKEPSSKQSAGGDKMEVDEEDSDATRSLASFGGNDGALSFGEGNNAGEGSIGRQNVGGEGGDDDEEAPSDDDESAPVQKRLAFPSTAKKPAAKKRRVIREEEEEEDEDSIMLEELAVEDEEEEAKADMATRRSRRRGARTPMLEEESEGEGGRSPGEAQGVPFTQAPAARDGTAGSDSDEDSSDDEAEVPPLTQALKPAAKGTRRSRRLRQTKDGVCPTVDRDAPADEDSEREFTAEASMAESEAEETVVSAPAKTKGCRGKKAVAAKAGEGKGKEAAASRGKGKAGAAKKAPVAVRKKPASNFERFVVPAAAKCAAEEASVAASEAEASKAKKPPRKTQAGQKKKKVASAKEQAKARRDELDFDEDEESTVVEASDEESAYEPTQGEAKAKKLSPRPARRSSSRARKGARSEAVAAEPARSPKAPRRRKKAKGAKEDDASALEEQIAAEVSASERKARSSKAGAGKKAESGAAGAPKGRGATTKTPEVVEEPRRRTRSSRAKQSKASVADDGAQSEDEGRKVRRGSSKGRDKSAKALELEEDTSSGGKAGRKACEGRDTRSKRAQKEVVESDDEEEQPVVNADDGDFGGDGGFEVEYGYPEAEKNEGEQTQNVMPFTQAPGSDDAEEEGFERGLELGKGEETIPEVRSIELTTRSFAEEQPRSRNGAGPSLSVDPSEANQKEARNDATSTIELSTRNMKMDQNELLAALQTQQETLTRSQLSSAVSPEPTASTMGGSSFGGEATMQDTEGAGADGSTVAPKGMNGDEPGLHRRLAFHLSEAQKILGQMQSSRTG